MPRQASDNTVVPAQFAAGVASDTDLPQTENVTSLGQTITIKGDLHAGENVIVNGRIEGTVDLPNHGVAVGANGKVDGGIVAKAVTILGSVTGAVTAEERIELRSTSHVEGRLVSTRVAMHDGAHFRGPIDTSRTDTDSRVGPHPARRNDPNSA
tara:strand:+ start:17 stop:478 length:462 start_codon:yes stop_codon:yes gene_type:complete